MQKSAREPEARVTTAATRGRERTDPPHRKGYMRLRRGLPEVGADGTPTSAPQWNYQRFPSRLGLAGTQALFHVIDRTLDAFAGKGVPPPEYALINIEEVADHVNVSVRHARRVIEKLILQGVLSSRSPGEFWWLKPHPELVKNLQVLSGPKRPGRRCKSREAAVPAPPSIAAYRQQTTDRQQATENAGAEQQPATVQSTEKVTSMSQNVPFISRSLAPRKSEDQTDAEVPDVRQTRTPAESEAPAQERVAAETSATPEVVEIRIEPAAEVLARITAEVA